jgi:hypothetical protein
MLSGSRATLEQFRHKWEPVLRPELRLNNELEHFRRTGFQRKCSRRELRVFPGETPEKVRAAVAVGRDGLLGSKTSHICAISILGLFGMNDRPMLQPSPRRDEMKIFHLVRARSPSRSIGNDGERRLSNPDEASRSASHINSGRRIRSLCHCRFLICISGMGNRQTNGQTSVSMPCAASRRFRFLGGRLCSVEKSGLGASALFAR